MKKLIVIAVAAFVGFFGGIPAHASPTPTPAECAESDTAPPGCPIDGANYPLVNPDGGTVPDTTPPEPPAVLPTTGSSGTTVLLQIGAMCLVGGMIVFVAARRRSTSTAPA